MSRTRGIDDGYAEVKEKDPGTALTKTALRRLIISGAIPSVRIGKKYLFDLDVLERYLSGEMQQSGQKAEPPQRGVIRRIGV